MGFTEQVYSIPLRNSMNTYQAYNRLLDIEMKALFSPQCLVTRIDYSNGSVVIKSSVAKMTAVCANDSIVFTCKMSVMWFVSSLMCFFFVGIMLLPPLAITLGSLSEGDGGFTLLMFIISGGIVSFLIWGGFYNRTVCFRRTQQIINVMCSYLQR